MKMNIRKKGKQTQIILKNLNKLNNSNLQVGHFEEDGLHGDSDLTYPDLLRIWSSGAAKGNEGVVKHPLANFIFTKIQNGQIELNPKIKLAFNRWSNNITSPTADNILLDSLGKELVEEYQSVFGKVGFKMPPVGNNTTPMLDTEELKENVRYKIGKG